MQAEELAVIKDRVEYAYQSVQDPAMTWCGSDACDQMVLDAAALLGHIDDLQKEIKTLRKATDRATKLAEAALDAQGIDHW